MSSRIQVYHADCVSVLTEKIKTETIDAIVTDVPYGVSYKNDIYDDSCDYVSKNMDVWMRRMFEALKDGKYAFVYVPILKIHKWIESSERAGFTFRNILATRTFNNGQKIINNFSFVMQPVLVLSKGKGRRFNKVNLFKTSKEWLNDKRNKKPCEYSFMYPNFISPDVAYGTEVFGSDRKSSDSTVHPNAKNVDLIRFLIELVTEKNEIVLDPFMGSGTTGVACVNSDRCFIGIESNEYMFNVSCNRIKNEMSKPIQQELF